MIITLNMSYYNYYILHILPININTIDWTNFGISFQTFTFYSPRLWHYGRLMPYIWLMVEFDQGKGQYIGNGFTYLRMTIRQGKQCFLL